MTPIAHAMLIGWLPVVMMIFVAQPPKKAVAIAFVLSWLALPNAGYSLPAIPDYTKMTATVMGVTLSAMIFDQARFFSVRFRWFDIPMVLWCFGAFVSALTNGLGPYEGGSSVLSELISWGLPYYIGRVYMSDAEGMRYLALAMAVGGLCYIPLCIYELRFSPVLQNHIYGVVGWEGERYGGYRPKVFLSTGLELGIWMVNATMVCWMLWTNRTVETIRGISMGKLTLAMLVMSFLCKSTGALTLLVFGMSLMWIVRRTKKVWILWLVLALPPTYCTLRGLNLWSARELGTYSRSIFGEERALSLEYRLGMEDLLSGKAREQPIFGWGRFNRFLVVGKNSVPDGFWIIAQGTHGLVGLWSILALFLLPLILTIRRFPVATWYHPQVGPLVMIAFLLVLTMIDFLSNAMLNPIYPLAIGGVMGQSPFRVGNNLVESSRSLEEASELIADGRPAEAEWEFHSVIERTSSRVDLEGRAIFAKALDGLGQVLFATGRVREAEDALREALVVRDLIAAEAPDPDRFADLAIAREGLSRAMAELGKISEAIEERRIALEIWDRLAADYPHSVDYRAKRADALNDLAWLMATDIIPRDPARVVDLAEEAVRISTDQDAFQNTLGVARYRAGDWAGAIEALERSALSSPGGQGTAFDHYFLAMAWGRLNHDDRAQEWLEHGIAWASRHRPGHPALERFRREAESLLQGEGDHVLGS